MYCLRIFLKLWKTNNFVKCGKSGRSVGQTGQTGLWTGRFGDQRRGARSTLKRFNTDPIKSRRRLFSVPTAGDRLSRLFVRSASPLGLAFVPQLLAFGQS